MPDELIGVLIGIFIAPLVYMPILILIYILSEFIRRKR